MPACPSRIGDIFDLVVDGAADVVTRLLAEAGGHRWQRVPPTERKGRVHTSTVTVAAFPVVEECEWVLRDIDILTFATRDSGPGGQHRNKTESCIVMRHIPTGIEAKASARCQHQNRRMARAMLESRVADLLAHGKKSARDDHRRQQVGTGMRGDKIRTYREQDDQVTDHRNGRKARLGDVRAGKLELLS